MENIRLNRLVQLPEYKKAIQEIKKFEEDRVFCKHNINHFLDVARISYIINLEQNYNISKEIIYTTAFVHDIGRHIQYKNNTPHEKASAHILVDMLKKCDYKEDEIEMIKEATLAHRDKKMAQQSKNPLSIILYKADKLSRSCFDCSSEDSCTWSSDKKNLHVKI